MGNGQKHEWDVGIEEQDEGRTLRSGATGRWREDTRCKGGIALWPCGPVVTSTCRRTLLDVVEVLAAPTEGVSRLQSHHLLFSHPPSPQRPVINSEYKFGHRSPALARIQCLNCRVKLKSFSRAWKAFHDPIFQPVSCRRAMFTHIPAIPDHLSPPAPVPLTLPSCPVRACPPSGRPFPCVSWPRTIPGINSAITITSKTLP